MLSVRFNMDYRKLIEIDVKECHVSFIQRNKFIYSARVDVDCHLKLFNNRFITTPRLDIDST